MCWFLLKKVGLIYDMCWFLLKKVDRYPQKTRFRPKKPDLYRQYQIYTKNTLFNDISSGDVTLCKNIPSSDVTSSLSAFKIGANFKNSSLRSTKASASHLRHACATQPSLSQFHGLSHDQNRPPVRGANAPSHPFLPSRVIQFTIKIKYRSHPPFFLEVFSTSTTDTVPYTIEQSLCQLLFPNLEHFNCGRKFRLCTCLIRMNMEMCFCACIYMKS
jgi:hypothetical protein